MSKMCECCGALEQPMFAKMLGAGIAFKIKTCTRCGLTYCSNCGVAKNKFDFARAMISPMAASNLAECPRCYPNGYRG